MNGKKFLNLSFSGLGFEVEYSEIDVQYNANLIPAEVKENSISVTRILSCKTAKSADF